MRHARRDRAERRHREARAGDPSTASRRSARADSATASAASSVDANARPPAEARAAVACAWREDERSARRERAPQRLNSCRLDAVRLEEDRRAATAATGDDRVDEPRSPSCGAGPTTHDVAAPVTDARRRRPSTCRDPARPAPGSRRSAHRGRAAATAGSSGDGAPRQHDSASTFAARRGPDRSARPPRRPRDDRGYGSSSVTGDDGRERRLAVPRRALRLGRHDPVRLRLLRAGAVRLRPLGISLPRTAAEQAGRHAGASLADAQPGDLVFFAGSTAPLTPARRHLHRQRADDRRPQTGKSVHPSVYAAGRPSHRARPARAGFPTCRREHRRGDLGERSLNVPSPGLDVPRGRRELRAPHSARRRSQGGIRRQR